MPAYFDTGFSVREPMWHGEGIVLGEYPEDWLDARTKAGLLWEPQEHPAWVMRKVSDFGTCPVCEEQIGAKHDDACAYADLGKGYVERAECLPAGSYVTAEGEHVFVVDAGHKQVVRSDTMAVIGSGLSKDYSLITHGHVGDGIASMQQIIEAFADTGEKVKFETAGSCKDGEMVWALMYLDEAFSIKGDPNGEHLPFLGLVNPHNGTGACKAINTDVRIVCWNTCQRAMASGDRTGRQFSFRHVGDVESRIQEAKDALAGLRNDTADYVEMCNELMTLTITDKHLSVYLSEFLPNPAENGEHVSDRVQANVEKARDLFKHIYTDSITCQGITGTGYGLLQASTEYLDWGRRSLSTDSLMGRSLLGREPVKEKAVNLIRALA